MPLPRGPLPLRSLHKLGLLEDVLSLYRTPCSKYENGCPCPQCQERLRQVSERGFDSQGRLNPPKAPEQPWDGKKAA